jgi:predicted Kef-type K+ transport protein
LDLDPVLIGVAFVMGFVASRLGLPPLAGFLVAGFVLHALGLQGGEALARVSDLGITLLLFTIGLKLDLASLLRRESASARCCSGSAPWVFRWSPSSTPGPPCCWASRSASRARCSR